MGRRVRPPALHSNRLVPAFNGIPLVCKIACHPDAVVSRTPQQKRLGWNLALHLGCDDLRLDLNLLKEMSPKDEKSKGNRA
jgi:hypothetical protein